MLNRTGRTGRIWILAVGTLLTSVVHAQTGAPPNSQPNPYQKIQSWGRLPAGRVYGNTSAIHVDSKDVLWIADKCGGTTCAGRPEAPIMAFDAAGALLKSLGSGLLVAAHGMYVDREGNVWVTDYMDQDGKGQQVIKLSPDGKVLLALGRAGVKGNGPDTFNQPSDVVVAPNGDVFVADGHGGESNARIVKFTKDGKFIKTWGQKGTGPGEFDTPHALAFDSQGRLFVGDRGNSRIQIFDQEGTFLAEWRQFGRPSGIFIGPNDALYVADSESNPNRNPAYKRGLRVGSAKDGTVTVFVPISGANPDAAAGGPEGIAADSKGVIFGAETGGRDVKRYAKN
jgi:sugar lactone lactonase YvrE